MTPPLAPTTIRPASLSTPSWRPCIIVPVYDQPMQLEAVLNRLKTFSTPIILVDDGSHEPTKSLCDKLAPLCARVVHLPKNEGKGGAVMAGFKVAGKLGFTHALQVDADGQIDISELPAFFRLSQKHPSELICGYPKYDKTVPKTRLWGRCLTNFWCSVNSLSLSIVDAMCGLRIYPLDLTLDVCSNTSLGKRMEFDPEILVRLLWAGVRLRNVPVAVTYPKDGVSHFHPFGDNARISLMHTRLFIRMATTFPIIIWSRIVGRSPMSCRRDRSGKKVTPAVAPRTAVAKAVLQPQTSSQKNASEAARRATRAAMQAQSDAERVRSSVCANGNACSPSPKDPA